MAATQFHTEQAQKNEHNKMCINDNQNLVIYRSIDETLRIFEAPHTNKRQSLICVL